MSTSALPLVARPSVVVAAIVGGVVAVGWLALPAIYREWVLEHPTLVVGGAMVLALAIGFARARLAPSAFAVDVTGDPPPDVPVHRVAELERTLGAEGFRLLGLLHLHVPGAMDAVVPFYVTTDGAVLAEPLVGRDRAQIALTTILEDGFSVCSVPAGTLPAVTEAHRERRVYPGGVFPVLLAAHRERVAALAAARSTAVARHDRALALGNERHFLGGRVHAERVATRIGVYAMLALALAVVGAVDALEGWAAAGAVGAGVVLVPVVFAAVARVEAALVARHRPGREPAAAMAARGADLRPVVAGPLLG